MILSLGHFLTHANICKVKNLRRKNMKSIAFGCCCLTLRRKMSLPCLFLLCCSFSNAVCLTKEGLRAFETLRKTERELTHEWSVVQDTACQASVEREVVRGGGSRFHPPSPPLSLQTTTPAVTLSPPQALTTDKMSSLLGFSLGLKDH